MRNGKPFNNGVVCTGRLLCLLCLLCLCVCMVSMSACRSSHSVVEKAQSEESVVVREIEEVGSVGNAAAACEERTDSAAVRADDYGVLTISRDSAGRIAQVVATRLTNIVSTGRSRTESGRWFYGLNATRCSEASVQVDTVGEKKAEAASAAEVRVPLMVRVGWCLVVMVIMFYVGDYICRRWIAWKR